MESWKPKSPKMVSGVFLSYMHTTLYFSFFYSNIMEKFYKVRINKKNNYGFDTIIKYMDVFSSFSS